jgi:beta-mannosidase
MTTATLLTNPIREGWTLTHAGGDAPASVVAVTHFAATEPTAGERVDLAIDGPQTVIAVTLNGTELRLTADARSGYRFDVREAIAPGSNLLEVAFAPGTEAAEGVRIERWRVARLASVRPLDATGAISVEVERASDALLTVVATVAGVGADSAEASITLAPGVTSGTVVMAAPNAEQNGVTVELHSPDEHLDTCSLA